ncbi:uncharacterized protein LOC129765186 isoform X1 [Toxorhynchites rutilus septentrionalis]|uniref:uncharacterized protein LOC129765186 isoform X1 n=1 Tax=Toxorhynchites rutilus septentrionalis TaxID=329112 RepID=UPI002479E6CC|nr:uncharacterized protein LOC129765186 isoform X1 [Toxorhynchites rutilus septentrionalis]
MKQFILILALAALIGHSRAQGNQRNCAANGGYCLTHNECCSGSCLSFSYKCVPTPPGAIVGTTFVPVTVANRFGNDGGASFTQKTCALNGEYCQIGIECCSGSCLTSSFKCIPGSGTASSQRPAATADVGNRVGEDQSTSALPPVTSTVSSAPPRCAALGEYCLNSADCCSGSCLSFSYKCVTNPQIDVGQSQPVQPVASSAATTTIPGGVTNRLDVASPTTPPKSCAAIGEYCLTASDCCSRSCLSFSYKCVQNYNLADQQITQSGIPVQLPASSSNANAIDTANRFGGGSGTQCRNNGLYCFHNGECCSGACHNSFCKTEIKLGTPESELTRPSIAGGPYVQVNNLDELITRFGGGSDSSPSASLRQHQAALIGARSTAGKQCAVVGEGCSRQEDCCSQRCHSYRRKCVT